jgi:crotonobetaine/carnitine-CoA ligase
MNPVMPRSMLPRYIDFVEELPKTDATLRTKKARLRELPLTADTWDAEAARSRSSTLARRAGDR